MSDIQKARNTIAHPKKYRPELGGVATKFRLGKNDKELQLNQELVNDLSKKCHDVICAIGVYSNYLQGIITSFE